MMALSNGPHPTGSQKNAANTATIPASFLHSIRQSMG